MYHSLQALVCVLHGKNDISFEIENDCDQRELNIDPRCYVSLRYHILCCGRALATKR